ncbi:MAG: hypothetical protein B7Z80_20950 [Rhodospirillales bacterium 20-64-7]|nr:MAG: hypothetical protein B7Z80_20950 [Rhodospirillales bacterium 20-64-7]
MACVTGPTSAPGGRAPGGSPPWAGAGLAVVGPTWAAIAARLEPAGSLAPFDRPGRAPDPENPAALGPEPGTAPDTGPDVVPAARPGGAAAAWVSPAGADLGTAPGVEACRKAGDAAAVLTDQAYQVGEYQHPQDQQADAVEQQ